MPGWLNSLAWRQGTKVHVALFRLSGGRVGGKARGAPVVLLHHIGRKSGQERVSPLLYLPDGDDVIIIASKGGAPKNPAWFVNLREMAETTIELPGEKRRVSVQVLTPEQKAEVWPRIVELYPGYAEYQERTERDIPVIRLSPVPSPS